MKKIIGLLFVVVLAMCIFTEFSFNNLAPKTGADSSMLFSDQSGENSNGIGSSSVLYNPQELGTTTLFSGTSVTAQGTVSDKNINFNIYGNDNISSEDTKIVTSRPEYYLIPNNRAFINTGIVPNAETTLEIFFMLPDDFSSSSEGGNHPDIAGCNASSNGAMHFGGPLILHDRNIQFLYGTWPGNSEILTAKTAGGDNLQWVPGNQYHSKLIASGGSVDVSLSDNIGNSYQQTYADNISAHTFNSLYLFGQNNNSSLVNPVKAGIKEVKITKNGTVVRHFFAVPQGSTEFSSTAAPSNCMYDAVSGNYFQNNNGSGSFSVIADSSGRTEIDVTEITQNLTGVKIDEGSSYYTYIDGNGNKWAADYLKVDQENGKVWLYEYNGNISAGNEITEEITYTPTEVPSGSGTIGERLLNIKTTNNVTVLSNDSGFWMDGIIGPIIYYEIALGTDSINNQVSFSGSTQISILNLSQNLTAGISSGTFNFATWKVEGAAKDFQTSKITSFRQTSLTAKDILFAPDRIMQSALDVLNDGNYSLKVDINFIAAEMSEIIVTVGSNIGIEIGGILQPTAMVRIGDPVTIKGIFDEILYEFDYEATVATLNGGYFDLSHSQIQNSITFTPNVASGTIELEYKIKPREYSVQILGKTTNNDAVFLPDSIKNGCTDSVYYDRNAPVTLNINGLNVENEYFIEGMFFSDTCLYVFDYFQCNGQRVTGGLSIDSFMLQGNSREDGKFTIYAVYQKKFIIDLGFEFEGSANSNSQYELSSPSAEEFNRNGINGYSINEGETAVIILNPDKRYSILSVSGDGGMSQISPTDLPELLVIVLDQSYDIIISLKHRVIKVDYVLNITDNNSREIFGVPDYISNGTNDNFTMISFEDTAQALTANQETLDMFSYRSKALMIYNFVTSEYDLITEKFTDGKLDAKNNDFFEFYVDEYGNSRVCLFVIQQYFVDFSTPGFTQNDTTFSNNDLGSYTIEFIGGEFTSLGSGKFAVDFGTQIRLEKTVGKYGKFVHFTGLDDEENNNSSLYVYGDRYIGANFESTKLAPWIQPTLFGGSGLLFLLILMAILLIMRSKKLKREKLAREAEIRDMKRKFNIADEISKLRNGEDVPQS